MNDRTNEISPHKLKERPILPFSSRMALVIGFLGIILGATITTSLFSNLDAQMQNNLAERMVATVTAQSPEAYQYELDQIPRNIRDATVEIILGNPNGPDYSGSGLITDYILDQEGNYYAIMLTASHVFNNKESFPITYIRTRTPGQENYVDSRKCKSIPQKDIGICALALGENVGMMDYVKPLGINNLKIYDPYQDGSDLNTFGFPGTPYDGTGYASSLPFTSFLPDIEVLENGQLLSKYGLAVPGGSGGPAYSEDGKVIGVLSKYNRQFSDLFDLTVDGAIITPIDGELIDNYYSIIQELVPNAILPTN